MVIKILIVNWIFEIFLHNSIVKSQCVFSHCRLHSKNKVINLSPHTLSQHEITVLSKGLKFVARPQEMEFSQVKIHYENFGRRLQLKWFVKENDDFPEVPAFRPKSKFNPRNNNVAIAVFLFKLEDELMKIPPEGCN